MATGKRRVRNRHKPLSQDVPALDQGGFMICDLYDPSIVLGEVGHELAGAKHRRSPG
jgi:hypothetical protein